MKGFGLNILITCFIVTLSWTNTSAAPIQKQSTYKYQYSQLLVEEQSGNPLNSKYLQEPVSNNFLSQLQRILGDFKSHLQRDPRSNNNKPVGPNDIVEDNDTQLPSLLPKSVSEIRRAIFGSKGTNSSMQEDEGKSICREHWTAPWQVALMVVSSTGTQRCGGVLIHKRWVLTAAHCVSNASIVFAMVGSKRYSDLVFPRKGYGQVRQIENFIVHHEYKPSSDSQPPRHDIALLELKSDVELGPDVKAAHLPKRNSPLMEPDTEMVITGWGFTENDLSPNELNCARLPIISRDECETAYRKQGVNIRNSHVCAGFASGGVGGCNGDSGGGLIHQGTTDKNTVIGLVSWTPKKQCGEQYTVYTDVRKHRPWILSKVEELGGK